MLSRSKSAPKNLDTLSQVERRAMTSALPRSRTAQTSLNTYFASATSQTTPLATPWEAKEDPFSLGGFFPSRLTEPQTEWDWVNPEKPELHEDLDEEDGMSYPDEDDGLRTIHDAEESFEEFARQVIDGEDKYGMLGFSSEKIPGLLKAKMPQLLEGMGSPMGLSPLSDDESAELDADAVYTRYCLRRRDSEEREAKEETGEGFGRLFLAKEVTLDGPAILPHWVKVLNGWVGSARAWL